MTLTEALQLASVGALPKGLAAALCGSLAVESQPRMEAVSYFVPRVLTRIFNSVFILTHDGRPTCRAAGIILGREGEETRDGVWHQEGVEGLRGRLEVFRGCPTYHDHVRWLWAKVSGVWCGVCVWCGVVVFIANAMPSELIFFEI